jgi:hypothetical protein
VSHDGISWLRGDGLVEGHRGSAKAKDVGVVLGPNSDNWWTLDTCHLAVSDVQVCLVEQIAVVHGTGLLATSSNSQLSVCVTSAGICAQMIGVGEQLVDKLQMTAIAQPRQHSLTAGSTCNVIGTVLGNALRDTSSASGNCCTQACAPAYLYAPSSTSWSSCINKM